MPLTKQELVLQLDRQLRFLQNSAAAFDRGDEIEAIRIAVVIRVLLHDTPPPGNSISLLQHMSEKTTLQVISTAAPLPADHANYTTLQLLRGQTFGEQIRYTAVPSDSPLVTADAWWKQPIYSRDGRVFTRQDVVTTTANKDGGAHVSPPNAKLTDLRKGIFEQVTTAADGSPISTPVENEHFRMLRRLADELLNSPELLALAK